MNNKEYFNEYMQVFLKQNAMLNLISKKDEQFLYEKHIYDSLAIENFFEKYKNCPLPMGEGGISVRGTSARNSGEGLNLLDIGTGGGFPSVPIALAYPNIQVHALDSIRKKINAIENIKSELNIKNLHTICDRVENINQKFDLISSRAVATLDKISSYALPLLKKDGYFVAYKSIKAQEEIAEAKNTLKKFNAEVIDIIEYDLPLEENHTRNLIVIKFK